MKDNYLSEFKQLFQQKQFFELRDEVAKHDEENSPEMLFYRGVVANKFNRTQDSIELLKEYLETAKPIGRRLCDCYDLLGDNYAKTYQYQQAAEKFEWLMENCDDEYSDYKKQDVEYSYDLWNAVKDISPQQISFNADTDLKFKRSKMNLIEIPVGFNGQEADFVFDTGANVSCITLPTAERMGLQILDAKVSIGTGTNIRVDVNVGIASEMQIGNIKLENVIFFVFQEEALYIKKYDYQIDGIIGHPVMQAFRRISISTNGNFFIPANFIEHKTEQNLCFDDCMPLLNLSYKEQPMSFIFDTGGRSSQFWKKFFRLEKNLIEKKAKIKQTNLAGAGGEINFSVYILDELKFPFSGKTITLEQLRIVNEPINYLMQKYFGLIGQDFITQFKKITIDFDTPSIFFE